jgi:hypothetical protein
VGSEEAEFGGTVVLSCDFVEMTASASRWFHGFIHGTRTSCVAEVSKASSSHATTLLPTTRPGSFIACGNTDLATKL